MAKKIRMMHAAVSVVVYVLNKLPRKFSHLLIEMFRGNSLLVGDAVRYCCYKRLCNSYGDGTEIKSHVFIHHPQNLDIGAKVSINPFCFIQCKGGLKIGDHVAIGPHVTITTGHHNISDPSIGLRSSGTIIKPIEIGSNVWIGTGARILYGVKIGDGAVIGANAVVNHDVPSFTIVGGVPARVIKNRLDLTESGGTYPGFRE